MSFPYLDLLGFARRTVMAQTDVNYIENDSPGFTVQQIASETSYINGRLRKRYGNNGRKNSLPLGQSAPVLVATGTAPPNVSLQGQPVLGSMQVVITITTPGALGTALFSYSLDGGITTVTGQTTAASYVLGTSGMTILWNALGTYSTNNVYSAATPVPEIVLGWLTTLVTFKLYRKRGVNPQDPQIEILLAEVERTRDEIKEAADSKDGLFDLPESEDEDSAITTAGPLATSQTSPYVWQDYEQAVGRAQDAQGTCAVDLFLFFQNTVVGE